MRTVSVISGVKGTAMGKDLYMQHLDKLINKFIFRSRYFVDYAAHPYGYTELLMTGEKIQSLLMIMSTLILPRVRKH